MAPKKKEAKSDKGQQKALEKAKQKVVEDKTFGLKNKKKSKVVQQFIKNVQQQAKPPTKGPDQSISEHAVEKEEKKKAGQQAALLASLFKGTENVKKIAAEDWKPAQNDIKATREGQKIDLYIDQRLQKESADLNDATLEAIKEESFETDIVCKHFLDSVEKRQYGWFWICPNGGDNCKYRHCLPPGFVLKRDILEDDLDDDIEISIEEQIEEERKALPPGGTAVTLETFTNWKKRKEEQRLQKIEEERQTEAKKTGTRGLHILSGRDLFTHDPTLFVDDEGAASEEDYEDDEEYWNDTINENQRTIDQANATANDRAEDNSVATKREEDPADILMMKEDLFLDDVLDDLEELNSE